MINLHTSENTHCFDIILGRAEWLEKHPGYVCIASAHTLPVSCYCHTTPMLSKSGSKCYDGASKSNQNLSRGSRCCSEKYLLRGRLMSCTALCHVQELYHTSAGSILVVFALTLIKIMTLDLSSFNLREPGTRMRLRWTTPGRRRYLTAG